MKLEQTQGDFWSSVDDGECEGHEGEVAPGAASSEARRERFMGVLQRIIDDIEAGAGRWEMPWRKGMELPYNPISQHRYSGINILVLWEAAKAAGYESNLWATVPQWNRVRRHVLRGEKATYVLVPLFARRKSGDSKPWPYDFRLRAVFNIEQVTGFSKDQFDLFVDPIEVPSVQRCLDSLEIEPVHRGGQAYYSYPEDMIVIPDRSRFKATKTCSRSEAYNATLLHEVTHWTGHWSRCHRDFGESFGDEIYAFEELVAELGSAFLCSHFAISPVPRVDHAQYIVSWLGILRRNSIQLIRAASLATEAVDYIIEQSAKAGPDRTSQPSGSGENAGSH